MFKLKITKTKKNIIPDLKPANILIKGVDYHRDQGFVIKADGNVLHYVYKFPNATRPGYWQFIAELTAEQYTQARRLLTT